MNVLKKEICIKIKCGGDCITKLLTTYFSKLNKIPEDYRGLVICRFPPKWLDIRGDRRLSHIIDFAPYKETLLDYKRTGDWNTYVKRFTQQMNEDLEFKRLTTNLVNALNSGKKYCLICFEKDHTHCHRYLIAKWLEENYNVEWEEM